MSLCRDLWTELSSPGPRASCLLDHRPDCPTPPNVDSLSWVTPTVPSSRQAGFRRAGTHQAPGVHAFPPALWGGCAGVADTQGRESGGLGFRPKGPARSNMHLFNRYLLSSYYMAGTGPGPRDTAMDQADISLPLGC